MKYSTIKLSNIYFFFSNLIAKKFNNEVYSLAASIPSKSSARDVYKVLDDLEAYNDQRVMGNFY